VSDVRGAFSPCPACGGPLRERHARALDDQQFYECETCFGVWLDWFGEEASRVAQRLPPAPGGGRGDGRRGGDCPRDGSALVERAYLDSGPVVERCPACLGLFARRSQIAAMAAFHERIPVETEPIVWVSVLSRFWHAFVK
jgi:Zn-finger nucleic acid-binding protein